MREMVAELKKLRDSLNRSSKNCTSCGLRHYENKLHWHLAEKLEGAMGRLVHVIETSQDATKGDSHEDPDPSR
jgi:hypothetical protein